MFFSAHPNRKGIAGSVIVSDDKSITKFYDPECEILQTLKLVSLQNKMLTYYDNGCWQQSTIYKEKGLLRF